jgi:redox-sensitive bicupin YhaK (pirin superfamily)
MKKKTKSRVTLTQLLLLLPLTTSAFSIGAGVKQKHGVFRDSVGIMAPALPRSAGQYHRTGVLFADASTTSSTDRVYDSSGDAPSQRSVARLEKFARLPVWPAWNGVALFVLSRLLGEEVAAKLEDQVGGRVCPNFFVAEQTSPFVMLVHHRHSFAPWDPIRLFQKTFFPEGFPAHPHRGFITLTYILRGGFVHRDSLGVRQTYGAEARHEGKHSQLLTTGAGLLHEEMFDIQPDDNGGWPGFLQPSSQELYQLWLNVPGSTKLDSPQVDLLGGPTSTPTIRGEQTETIVLLGEHDGIKAEVETASDATVLHVQMEPNSVWTHTLPTSHETVTLYMRKGAATIGDMRIPPHYTAYMEAGGGNELTVKANGADGADFLLLAGAPLREPIQAQGSMVMNRPQEIDDAYRDYQLGKMGAPWKESLTDEQWQQHIAQYPSLYKYQKNHEGK